METLEIFVENIKCGGCMSGIKKPADFKGKTIGVWYGGNEYPFLSWMSKLGIKTDGSAGDNVQGAGNPSTIPTMNNSGKSMW